MQKLKFSIDDICEISGESRSQIYEAINAGHLKTFLVGRRRFAKPADAQAWIDFLQAQSDAGHPVTYQPRKCEGGAA